MADSVTQPPLRVLHLIESLGRGGAEQLLVTLLPALRAHNIEPLVAVLRPPLDLLTELEAAGIPVIRLQPFAKWNLFASTRILKEACDAAHIDVLHAHLYFPGIYAGLLSATHDATHEMPVFETFHNMAYAGANRGGLKLALRKHLRAFIARRSGVQFLAVSQAVAEHYCSELGLSQVIPLPNSVDLAAIAHTYERAHAASSGARLRAGPLKIIVPGRLVPEKGHIDLLDALSNAEMPPYTLHFLGGGPLEGELQDKARSLSIPVIISGLIPHDKFLAAMAVSDLCVAPSRFEGFGIAAAEAMALGIATIASDAGGLPEVVGDAGVIVKAGDTVALQNAIVDLARNPEKRASLAVAGKDRISTRFSSQAAAAELARLYHEARAS